jgi:hypothetical protein
MACTPIILYRHLKGNPEAQARAKIALTLSKHAAREGQRYRMV